LSFPEGGMSLEDVVIVGAGIGGLAAALALAQRGARVTVLERAAAITEVGAGIQVSPNGMRVLDALGVGDAVAGRAPRARAVQLWDGPSGARVLRLDLARHAPDQRYHFVHRADLIETLRAACESVGVTLRTGAAVRSVVPGAPAAAVLDEGETVAASLILGADGVRSVLRPVLNGPAQPRFTGQVAWRAIVPNTIAHPPEAWVQMGPGRHLVSYPLRDQSRVNIVAVEERGAWAEEGWDHRDSPEAVRAAFAGFAGPVPAMLAGLDNVGLWGLFRHPVAASWHGPGVALLGDAAHPTLPFLAQGANMALEDAWVLADCLAQGAQPEALASYQQRRRDRVMRVIEAADGNAWKYHLRNPLLRGAAHLGLSLAGRVAPAKMLAGFDWLYRHDVTRAAG
jgi:salicylate hydroxylase